MNALLQDPCVKWSEMREPVVSELESTELMEQIRRLRPELIVLYKKAITEDWGLKSVGERLEWDLNTVEDTMRLCVSLHEHFFCSHSNVSDDIRKMLVMYAKLRYLETFLDDEILKYKSLDAANEKESQLSRQLYEVFDSTEVAKKIAEIANVSSKNCQLRILLPFAEQTETLLTRGSDDRSILRSKKRNKYHASTFPEMMDVARGSCTCNSIGMRAFEKCDDVRQTLLSKALFCETEDEMLEIVEKHADSIRSRIANSLDISDLVDRDICKVILSPSGTDAELLATLAALCRSFILSGMRQPSSPVLNILTAKHEIGSGSALAAGWKHFSTCTPNGDKVHRQQNINGVAHELVITVELDGRDEMGDIVNQECQISRAISTLRAHTKKRDERRRVIVLHVVMVSKTGYCCPSLEFVDSMVQQFPDQLLIVIDACQMRLDRDAYRLWAQKGFVILVTGSKFLGGSPFCGAVIMPMRSVQDMEICADAKYADFCVPLGLQSYHSRFDFSKWMKQVRDKMGSHSNVGLLLRWESALVHMEPYYKIPRDVVRKICKRYIAHWHQVFAKAYSPLVQLFHESIRHSQANTAEADTQRTLPDIPSIISFEVWMNADQKFLEFDELKILHHLLTEDLSQELSGTKKVWKRCSLGQPVAVGPTKAVLRVAIGAEMINAIHYSNDDARMNEMLADDEEILQKIATIVDNWENLQAVMPEHCKR